MGYNAGMSIIVLLAKDLIYLVILIALSVLAWAAYRRKSWLRVGADAVAAGIVALALAKLAGKLYYDPRPFVDGVCQAVVPHAADNGFPSDHTLLGAALAAIVWRYSRSWAVVVGLLAAAVGIARVVGCIHSPVDIVSAYLIGIGGALAGRWLVDRFWPKASPTEKSA